VSFRIIASLACALALAPIQQSAGEKSPAVQDYPLFGHLEGYKVSSYGEERFDRYAFTLPDHSMTVEGHVIKVVYVPDGSQGPASNIELYRSYRIAVESVGGEVLRYDEDRGLTGRVSRDGTNIFMQVEGVYAGGGYGLTVVEERPFRPLIQVPSSAQKP
jgi:hypothetical protein